MATIHFFNPMESLAGGSEHRLIGLFEILGESEEVRIWSEGSPHPGFLGKVPIQKVTPTSFPKEGTFVFIGTYASVGAWTRLAKPSRIVIVHNIDQPDRLRGFVSAFAELGFPKPDIVYASQGLARSTPDYPGTVQDSPIDLERFAPAIHENRPFTIGRMSRDVGEKHHPEDPDLYRQLSAVGVQIRVMGGTRLGIQDPNVELLLENAEDAADFLRSLDAFVYRTHPNWYETFGRVAFEAMATGLPIVVEPRHGFADWLTDGETAIFAESTEDFRRAVERLNIDPELRKTIGRNAREMMERIYGADYRRRIRQFYSG
jgi:glycosyltransferase involved in cell wall biosynthesis